MARRLAIAFDLPSLAFVTGYLSVGHLATYRSTRVGRTMRWICSDCAWLFAASGCRHFSFSHWNCWRHRVAMRVNQRRAPWSTESLCGQEQYLHEQSLADLGHQLWRCTTSLAGKPSHRLPANQTPQFVSHDLRQASALPSRSVCLPNSPRLLFD